MKTINLYFDFEFTSLSPDAQPISLGIVSDMRDVRDYPLMTRPEKPGKKIEFIDQSLSFYAEFSDFDINRCDDWVKENVVGKLKLQDYANYIPNGGNKGMYEVFDLKDNSINYYGDTERIRTVLKEWLSQFSDYQITFVCDCGTFDWYWMLQLLAEWEEKEVETNDEDTIDKWLHPLGFDIGGFEQTIGFFKNRTGLPKLPTNISPVPQDLNDLIALRKGISVKEAFDLNREELAIGYVAKFMSDVDRSQYEKGEYYFSDETPLKHTAIWDAKVIKSIYEKLK